MGGHTYAKPGKYDIRVSVSQDWDNSVKAAVGAAKGSLPWAAGRKTEHWKRHEGSLGQSNTRLSRNAWQQRGKRVYPDKPEPPDF